VYLFPVLDARYEHGRRAEGFESAIFRHSGHGSKRFKGDLALYLKGSQLREVRVMAPSLDLGTDPATICNTASSL